MQMAKSTSARQGLLVLTMCAIEAVTKTDNLLVLCRSKVEIIYSKPLFWFCQVYSLDWDKRYLEDEAALREAGGYDAADTQLLDPLPPGAALWPDLTRPPVLPTDGPQLAPPEAGDSASSSFGRL